MEASQPRWSRPSGQTVVGVVVAAFAAILVLYPIFFLLQASLDVGDPEARPPSAYGFDNYATLFTPFYVFDQAQNRQVRVVYANAAAIAGQPLARGSILVMETYRADTNAQGDPVFGSDGRYVRDTSQLCGRDRPEHAR